MTLYSDVLFPLQRLGRTLPKDSQSLLHSLYPTSQCLPSPPVQALPTPSQRAVIMMGQGAQSLSAILLTPLHFLARRTMQQCQLFLQMQHPLQHFLYPQTVLLHLPTVKDPGAQCISATPWILLLLLQDHPLPPTRHLSVFQPVQAPLRPCPLEVKDPGAHSTSSAALPILLLLQRVLPAPQMMQHQHRFLLVRPPPQRPPVAPRMYNVIV